jgi:hypothetical protein
MAVHSTPAHRRVSRFMQATLALAALLVLALMATARAGTPPWVEQKVFDSQGLGYDHFGTAVAIAGSTALIAAPEVSVDGNTSQGVVYVYQLGDDGTWSPTQKLAASDGAAYTEFGWAIALSGRTAVISAINAKIGDNISQGAAYVFTQADDGSWSEVQKLVASDGQPVDWFGSAVAMSGSTIVVGAYGAHYDDQAMRGALYVFNQVDGSWTQTQQLVADDGDVGDQLGMSVALSGSTLLASAPGKTLGENYAQGAVYAFTATDGVWTQAQKILAEDGAASDQLGTSLALDGDTALIGAVWHHSGHGVVYALDRIDGVWTAAQQLAATDGATPRPAGIGLPTTDNFGLSVALQGGTALIGADLIPVNGNDGQGVVYRFARQGGAWSGTLTFIASDGMVNDYLGCAVAFDGANVLAGAFGYTPDFDHYQQGAAYFFRTVAAGISSAERAALVDLYNSTGGSGWWDTVGWLGEPGTECSWTGITCDDSGTQVIGLSLLFANLTGTLPDSLNGLTHLTSLQINDNRNLTGSVPSLAGMSQLQSIDLSRNAFTGDLPSLAGLTALQFAIFSDNQFSGSMPPFDGLASLQWFAASTNQLSGAIPSLAGLGALTGFYVDYNQLSGPPPALPSPTSLGQYGAALCPNALDHVDSTEWDTITGVTPWYQDCVATPTETVFSDGFDGA